MSCRPLKHEVADPRQPVRGEGAPRHSFGREVTFDQGARITSEGGVRPADCLYLLTWVVVEVASRRTSARDDVGRVTLLGDGLFHDGCSCSQERKVRAVARLYVAGRPAAGVPRAGTPARKTRRQGHGRSWGQVMVPPAPGPPPKRDAETARRAGGGTVTQRSPIQSRENLRVRPQGGLNGPFAWRRFKYQRRAARGTSSRSRRSRPLEPAAGNLSVAYSRDSLPVRGNLACGIKGVLPNRCVRITAEWATLVGVITKPGDRRARLGNIGALASPRPVDWENGKGPSSSSNASAAIDAFDIRKSDETDPAGY